MARSIHCPLNEAPCFDPECSVTHCRDQEREKAADFKRKAERTRGEWEHAKDRQEAARRALRELVAERNAEREAAGEALIPMPRGRKREDLIARMLVSERQA